MATIPEKLRRLLSWARGKPAPPYKVQLNPTNRCNLKCIFCETYLANRVNKFNHKLELPMSRYMEIVEEGAELGVKEWQITGGGEPTVRPAIIDLMREIKRHDMFGEMNTNGYRLPRRMIKAIVECGWDTIIFSVDAPDAKTHDALRGVHGAFKNTIDTIKAFRDYKNALGCTKPQLVLHLVLCNRNYHKLSKMVTLARRCGCECLFVQPITIATPGAEKLRLSTSELQFLPQHIQKAKKYASKHGILTNIDNFMDTELVSETSNMDSVIAASTSPQALVSDSSFTFTDLYCFEPWCSMIIRPDGTSGPCCVFAPDTNINAEPKHIGNNLREASLEDVWFGEYFNYLRRSLVDRKLPHFCRKCTPHQVVQNRIIREELKKIIHGGHSNAGS